MEMSQNNTLYSYLKLTKMSLFTKTDHKKGKQVLSGGLVPVGRERIWGKGEYSANIVHPCM
jgi:hypothetical protein